ncbi:MAG: hypothetical protein CMB77_04160 [Euryarchaeota archaeon]|nr:hypothetical protein [Euryarchaeota archaeon]|tara:strand:+ start:11473 stop:11730 length:258 start_codon:yes stop_codon:yes gene_type:complete
MLNEIKWKDFFADCATYVISENKSFRINGDKKIAEATANALSSSRKLYNVLCSEQSSILEVKTAIISKKKAANQFLKTTGICWPF